MEKGKRAVVVGIDHYQSVPELFGSVKDATRLAELLSENADGTTNFDCHLRTSLDSGATSVRSLKAEIQDLFGADAECALFYFSGHASPTHLLSQDARDGDDGIGFEFLLSLANQAYPRIQSTVIILDACHLGAFGSVGTSSESFPPAALGTGVTILSATDRGQAAKENTRDGGLFSSIAYDALAGRAADLRGHVTPAALYAHVDQLLGPWDQRPLYKANVKGFLSLRRCEPKIDLKTLKQLPVLFPNADEDFPLDPSFEPDCENVPAEFRDLPVDEENTQTFKKLQACNRLGLIEPVDAEHMYYAAIYSKACRLTQYGKHYRQLALRGRI